MKIFKLLALFWMVAIASLVISACSNSNHFISPEPMLVPNPTPTATATAVYPLVNQWGGSGSAPGNFSGANGIAVDTSGNVYVSDMFNQRVQRFALDGTFRGQWGSGPGALVGQFNQPLGIAVNSAGSLIYVSDSGNNRIQVFDPNGAYQFQWGSFGSSSGQFNFPTQVAVDSLGDVYVVDQNNSRVQKFDYHGAWLAQWGTCCSGDGQFNFPYGIAVNSAGTTIYVSDKNNNRVQVFNSRGDYLFKWGSAGNGTGQFSGNISLAMDNDGNIFAADGSARVQKFSSDGTFLAQWRGGNGNNSFIIPAAIAADFTGYVYLATSWGNRVQVFAPH
jgi:DNA-binding beta-propeller fold protein YncE